MKNRKILVLLFTIAIASAIVFLAKSVKATDASPIQNVHSITHQVAVWSGNYDATFVWEKDPNAPSDINGYSFVCDTNAATIPPEIINLAESNFSTGCTLSDKSTSNYFHIRTKDNHGVWSDAIHLGPFWYDSYLPRIVLHNPTDGSWQKSYVEFHFTQLWGDVFCVIVIDSIPLMTWSNSSGEIYYYRDLEEGAHNWKVRCVYNGYGGGTYSESAILNFNVDNKIPIVEEDYGIKNDTWQKSDQTIHLTTTDQDISSGILWTKYCVYYPPTPACIVDDTHGISYGQLSPPIIDGVGDHMGIGIARLRYNAKDRAGNIFYDESQGVPPELIVKIDKIAPSARLDEPVDGSIVGAVVGIKFSTSDDLSGVSSCSLIDNDAIRETYLIGTPTDHQEAHQLTFTSGKHLWKVVCNDMAGNEFVTDIRSFTVVIPDTTPPITTVSTSPITPDGNDGYYTTTPNISLTAIDGSDGSGLKEILYRWDSNPYQTYNSNLQGLEGVHTLSYYAIDNAGNAESEHQLVIKVNTTPPSPPSPPPPVVTPDVPSVPPVVVPVLPLLITEPAPTITPGKVLGVTTTRPILKALKLTNGAYSYKLNGKKITFRPFGTSYKGVVWARSVDFGPDGKIYVFINSGAYSKGQIKVYKADGKLLKAYNPYGGFATNGLNATTVVEYDDNVYLSVGTTKAGTTVKSYQVTAKGLTALKSITATQTRGNVLVGFQKLYKDQYGLVTMMQNSRSTLKVWKLDLTTNKFVEDKKIKKSKIKI